MTENEIKEMLNDIINNGAEYECRFIAGLNPHTWKPYKLGEGINEFYEYRKVEKWYVFCYGNNDYIIIKDVTSCGKPCVFEGTKKECEKWVEEHTKTWLEDYIDRNYGNYIDRNYGNSIRLGAKIICEKILEELKDEKYLPTYEGIFNLIKDLGIEAIFEIENN